MSIKSGLLLLLSLDHLVVSEIIERLTVIACCLLLVNVNLIAMIWHTPIMEGLTSTDASSERFLSMSARLIRVSFVSDQLRGTRWTSYAAWSLSYGVSYHSWLWAKMVVEVRRWGVDLWLVLHRIGLRRVMRHHLVGTNGFILDVNITAVGNMWQRGPSTYSRCSKFWRQFLYPLHDLPEETSDVEINRGLWSFPPDCI